MASSQGKFYALLGAVLVAGVALIGYVAVNKNRRAVADAAETAAALPAMLAEGELVGEDVGVAMGPEDAPVIIHEYADYQCPYCGMVATLTLPQIFEEYVQTGKARFVFFDYPLNPGASEIGAEAARCAIDQDAFWAMQKVLFGRMQEWGTKRNPNRQIREYADALGLDGGALLECMDSHKYRDVVMASQLRARQLGLNSTPTFFINGQLVPGAKSYDQMKAIIDEELAKVESP
jgi:protein-disulfide isomerase